MNLLNITEAPAENLAGLDNIVYIGLVADAASIPVKHAVDVLLDPTVWVNLATPPVMKTGKKMVSIRVTPDSIKFDADGQGELDGKSIKNKLEFSIPGLTDENLALVSATNNADLFFIFSHNGQYHLMGNKERPANAESPKGTSGGKATDGKKITYSFSQDWSTPAPIITLTTANIEALLLPAI